jgi:hypothetical protein
MLEDREHDKFTLNKNNDTAVRTVTEISGGTIDTVPSGLNEGFRVTTMNVTDVAGAIPPTALANRNAISIVNLDEAETIYCGPTLGVTADRSLGTTAGFEVGPNESFNLDVTDVISIFAIAESGKTVKIKVLEIA